MAFLVVWTTTERNNSRRASSEKFHKSFSQSSSSIKLRVLITLLARWYDLRLCSFAIRIETFGGGEHGNEDSFASAALRKD
mmetsp:Transcript_13002/g.29670  ORF Transcript_13002/g.29670 Transcript_13002/m.29670 type:complete len:81 (-) Transcript_13002:2401-2643(-)